MPALDYDDGNGGSMVDSAFARTRTAVVGGRPAVGVRHLYGGGVAMVVCAVCCPSNIWPVLLGLIFLRGLYFGHQDA